MDDWITYATSPVMFVHLAVFCYVTGMLTRHELFLRVSLLIGTIFYILYYYFIASSPLWEAIFASSLIGAANVHVIYRIFQERSTFGMSSEMLSLYKFFPNFNPGQFRRILAEADIVYNVEDKLILAEGETPERLFLTFSDGFIVSRGTQQAEIGPGNFLGEISFLLGGSATADVTATAGSTYVVWDISKLRRLMTRNDKISNAMSVLLNKDVASKLAVSFPVRAKSVLPNAVQDTATLTGVEAAT